MAGKYEQEVNKFSLEVSISKRHYVGGKEKRIQHAIEQFSFPYKV